MASFRPISVVLGAAAVLAGLGIAVEVGSRLLLRAQGTPWSGWRTRDYLIARCQLLEIPWDPAPARSAGDESVGMQPFTAWEPADVHDRVADDLERYREPGAEAAFDVLVLGGAAAGELAGSPGLAQELARTRADGREVRIHGYAVDDYKQPQPERMLTYLLSLGHRPDLVVEVDGLAEGRDGWANARAGTCPLYPVAARWAERSEGTRYDWRMVELLHELSVRRERARAFGDELLRFQLWHSCVLGHLGRLRFESLQEDAAAAEERARAYLDARPKEAELSGPSFPSDPDACVDRIARSWEEGVVDMYAMCAARGIGFLQVLEPIPAEARRDEGVGRVLPVLREAGSRLAARGITFLDASDLASAPASTTGLAREVARAASGR